MQKPKRRSFNRGNKLPWLAGLAAPAAFLHALPNGGEVKAGSADITASASSDLLISQQSERAVIHWKDFDIDKGETVTFSQPSKDAWVLNRDISGAASNILGDLSANGGVFLLNPHGILVGDGARLDVGSLVMTTADIESEDDFMSGGHIRFSLSADARTSRLLNQGEIRTQEGGFIGLIGARVENQGKIAAAGGVVQIASSKSFYVDFTGDALIGFEASSTSPITGAGIEQTEDGSVEAGTVIMTAHTAQNIMDRVINLDGVVRARGLSGNGGRVNAGEGHVRVEGSVDAGADGGPDRPATPGGAGEGGQLDVFGAGIILAEGSKLRTDGERRAGAIRIGGDYQGDTATLPDRREQITLGSIQNAQSVIVQSGALIQNRASVSHEKPQVSPSPDAQHSAIFWADKGMGFYGTVDASGGEAGGFIEISGRDGMDLGDEISINAASVLFDPWQVTWQAGTTDLDDNEKDLSGFDAHSLSKLTINGAFWTQFLTGSGVKDVIIAARNRILITGDVNPPINRSFNLSLLISAYGGYPAGAVEDPGIIFKDATLGSSSNNKIRYLYISTGKAAGSSFEEPFVSFSGGTLHVAGDLSIDTDGGVVMRSLPISAGSNFILNNSGGNLDMILDKASLTAGETISFHAGRHINISSSAVVSATLDILLTAGGAIDIRTASLHARGHFSISTGENLNITSAGLVGRSLGVMALSHVTLSKATLKALEFVDIFFNENADISLATITSDKSRIRIIPSRGPGSVVLAGSTLSALSGSIVIGGNNHSLKMRSVASQSVRILAGQNISLVHGAKIASSRESVELNGVYISAGVDFFLRNERISGANILKWDSLVLDAGGGLDFGEHYVEFFANGSTVTLSAGNVIRGIAGYAGADVATSASYTIYVRGLQRLSMGAGRYGQEDSENGIVSGELGGGNSQILFRWDSTTINVVMDGIVQNSRIRMDGLDISAARTISFSSNINRDHQFDSLFGLTADELITLINIHASASVINMNAPRLDFNNVTLRTDDNVIIGLQMGTLDGNVDFDMNVTLVAGQDFTLTEDQHIRSGGTLALRVGRHLIVSGARISIIGSKEAGISVGGNATLTGSEITIGSDETSALLHLSVKNALTLNAGQAGDQIELDAGVSGSIHVEAERYSINGANGWVIHRGQSVSIDAGVFSVYSGDAPNANNNRGLSLDAESVRINAVARGGVDDAQASIVIAPHALVDGKGTLELYAENMKLSEATVRAEHIRLGVYDDEVHADSINLGSANLSFKYSMTVSASQANMAGLNLSQQFIESFKVTGHPLSNVLGCGNNGICSETLLYYDLLPDYSQDDLNAYVKIHVSESLDLRWADIALAGTLDISAGGKVFLGVDGTSQSVLSVSSGTTFYRQPRIQWLDSVSGGFDTQFQGKNADEISTSLGLYPGTYLRSNRYGLAYRNVSVHVYRNIVSTRTLNQDVNITLSNFLREVAGGFNPPEGVFTFSLQADGGLTIHDRPDIYRPMTGRDNLRAMIEAAALYLTAPNITHTLAHTGYDGSDGNFTQLPLKANGDYDFRIQPLVHVRTLDFSGGGHIRGDVWAETLNLLDGEDFGGLTILPLDGLGSIGLIQGTATRLTVAMYALEANSDRHTGLNPGDSVPAHWQDNGDGRITLGEDDAPLVLKHPVADNGVGGEVTTPYSIAILGREVYVRSVVGQTAAGAERVLDSGKSVVEFGQLSILGHAIYLERANALSRLHSVSLIASSLVSGSFDDASSSGGADGAPPGFAPQADDDSSSGENIIDHVQSLYMQAPTITIDRPVRAGTVEALAIQGGDSILSQVTRTRPDGPVGDYGTITRYTDSAVWVPKNAGSDVITFYEASRHPLLPFLQGRSLLEGEIGRRGSDHQPFDVSLRPAQSWGFFTFGSLVIDGGSPARGSIGWLQVAGDTVQLGGGLFRLADGYADEYLGVSGQTIEHLPGFSIRLGDALTLSVGVADTLSLRLHAGAPVVAPQSNASNVIHMEGSVGGLMDLSLSNAEVSVRPHISVRVVSGNETVTKTLGPGLQAATANITLHGSDISWHGGLSVVKALGIDFDGTMRSGVTVNRLDLRFSEDVDLDTLTLSARVGEGLTVELTSSHYAGAATHPLTGFLVSTGGDGLLVVGRLFNDLSITGVHQGNFFVDGGRLYRPDFYTVIQGASLYIDNLEATLSVMAALQAAAAADPRVSPEIASFNSLLQVADLSVVISLDLNGDGVADDKFVTVDLSHLDHSLYSAWRSDNDPSDTAAHFKRAGSGISLSWNSHELWGNQSTSLRGVLDSFNRNGLTVSVQMDTRDSGLNANARAFNATFASLGADDSSPGSLVLGDIRGVMGGNYTVMNGRIFQKAGTSIDISGAFGVAAPGVTLTNPGNRFGRLSVDQLSHADIPAANSGVTLRAESGFDLYAGGAVDLPGGRPYAKNITITAVGVEQPHPNLPNQRVATHLNPDGTPIRVRLMGVRNNVSLTVTAGAFEVNGRFDGNLTAFAPDVGELANMTISAEVRGLGDRVIDALALQGGVTVHSLVGSRQSYPQMQMPGVYLTLPAHISIRSGGDIVGNAHITAYGSLDLLAMRSIYLTNINSTLSGVVFASAGTSVDLRAQQITIGNLIAGQGAHLSAVGDVVGLDRTVTDSGGDQHRVPMMVQVNEGLTVTARNLIWNGFTNRHISLECDPVMLNQCQIHEQAVPFDPNAPIRILPSESIDFMLAVPGHVGLFADDETDFNIRAPSAEFIGILGLGGRSVYVSLPAGGPAGCQPPHCGLMLDRVSVANLTIAMADRDLAQFSIAGLVTQTLSARSPYQDQMPDADGYYHSVRPDGVKVSSMQAFPAYLPDAAGFYYTVVHHVLVTQTSAVQFQIDLRDFIDIRNTLSAVNPFPAYLPDADGNYHSQVQQDVQVSSQQAFPGYLPDADGFYYSVGPDGNRVASRQPFPGYLPDADGYYYSIKYKKGTWLSSKQPFPGFLPRADGYYYTVLPDSALPSNLNPIVVDKQMEVVLTETVHIRPTFSADTVRLIGGGNSLTLGNIGNNIATLSLENWKLASVWAMTHMYVSVDDVETLNLRAYLPAGNYVDGVHERAVTRTIRTSGNRPVEFVDTGLGAVVTSKMIDFCDYVSCVYRRQLDGTTATSMVYHRPLNGGNLLTMITFYGEPFIRHKNITRGLGFSARADEDRAGNITVVGTAGLKTLGIDGDSSGQVTVSYSNTINLGRVYAGGLSLLNAPHISGTGDISLGGGGLYLSSGGKAVFQGVANRPGQTLGTLAGSIGTLMATDLRAGLLAESQGGEPAIHGLKIGDLSAGYAQIDLRSGRMSIDGLLQAGESLRLTATDAIIGGSIRSNDAPVVLRANHIDLRELSGTAAKHDDESHGLANFTLLGIDRPRSGARSGLTISAIDAGRVNRVSVSAPDLDVNLNFGSARQPNLLIYAAGNASISAGALLNLMGAIVEGDLHAHAVGSVTYLPVSDTLGVLSPGSISIGGALHAGGQVVRLDHGSVAMGSLVLYSRSDGPSSSVTVVNADDLELYFADYQMRRGDGEPGGFAELTVHADGDMLLAEGSAAIHGGAHLSAIGNVSELYTSMSRFLHYVSTNAAGEVVTVSKNGNRAEVEVTGSSVYQLAGNRPTFAAVVNGQLRFINGVFQRVGGETVTAVANGDMVSITVTGAVNFEAFNPPRKGADDKWTITHVSNKSLLVVSQLDDPSTLYPNPSFTQVLIPGNIETIRPDPNDFTPRPGQPTDYEVQHFTLSYVFSQSFNLANDKGVVPANNGLGSTIYHSVGFKDDLRRITLPHIPGEPGLGEYDFVHRRWEFTPPGTGRSAIQLRDSDLDDPDFVNHFPFTMTGSGYTEVFHLRTASGDGADPDGLVLEISYQFSRGFDLAPSDSVAILDGGASTVFSDVGVAGNTRHVTVPRSGEIYIPVMGSDDEEISVEALRNDRFGVHLANFTISGTSTMIVDPDLDYVKLSFGSEVRTVQLEGSVFQANFPLTLHGDRGSRQVLSVSVVRDQQSGQSTWMLQVDYLLYNQVQLSGDQITALPNGVTTVFNNVGIAGNRRNVTVVREGVFAETHYADGATLTASGTLRIDAGGALSQRPNQDLGMLSVFAGNGYTLTEVGDIGHFLITGSYIQQQPTLSFERVEFAPNQYSLKYNSGYETVSDQQDQVIASVAGRRLQLSLGISQEVSLGVGSTVTVVPMFSIGQATGETFLMLSVSYGLVDRVDMQGPRVTSIANSARLVKSVGVAGVEVRDITVPEDPRLKRHLGGMTAASLLARAGGDMHLSQFGNDFGWVSLDAGESIHLLDAVDGLTLGGISAGDFTLSAFGEGDVHGSGPVTAGLADLSAPNGSIGLTAANHISTLMLSARHGTVNNGPGPDELTIDISVPGDMTLSAAQGVTQARALTVGGMLSIRAVGADERKDIVLDHSDNHLVTFAGVGDDITLVDSADGIELKDTLQANSLSIRQIQGNVNAPGVLEVEEDLEISAPQGNIQLSNKANRFNTVVSLTASGHVVLHAHDGLTLGGNVLAGGGSVLLDISAGGIHGAEHSVVAGAQDIIISVGGDFSIMHVEADGNIRIQGGRDGSISLLHAIGTNTAIVPGIFTSYFGNAIQIFVQGDLNVHTVRNQERAASLNGDRMNIAVGGSLSFSQLLGNGNMLLSVAGDMLGDLARASFAWLHASVGGAISVRTLDAQTSLTVSAGRDIVGRRWLGREGDVALSAPGTISLTDNLTGVQAGANLLVSAGYALYDPFATVMENGDILTVRLDPDGDVRVSMTHGAVFDTVDLGRVTVRAEGDVSLVPMSDGSTFTISQGELSTVIAGATIAYSRRGGSLTFTRVYNQIVTLESELVSVLPGAARTVVDVGVRGHKVTVVRSGIDIAGRAEAGQTLELIAAGSVIGGPVQAGNRLGVTAGGDIMLSSAFNVDGGDVQLSANGGSISISQAGNPTDGEHRFVAGAHADITIHSLTAGQLGATLSAGGDFRIHTASLNRLEAAGASGAVYEYGEVLTLGDLTVGDFTLFMTSTLSGAPAGDVRQDTAAAGATVGAFSFQGGNLNLTHSANSLDTVHLIDLPGPAVTGGTSIDIDQLTVTNTGALVLVPLPGTDITLSLPAGENMQAINGTSYVLNTIGSYVYVTTHLPAKSINIVDSDDLFIDASYLANHFPDGTLDIGGIRLMGGGHLTLKATGGDVHGRSITAGSFTLDAARADLYGALAGNSTGEAADHLFVNAERYVGPYLFNGRPGWQGRQTGLDHQDIGEWWQEGARFAADALETGHEIGEIAEARYAARTGRPHAGWFFRGASLDNFVVVRLSLPLINLLGLSDEDEQPILLFSREEDEDE
ncbi:MAG: filamentous hemagglutinin N-terminal domain-containing protein [Gammaproteobacteria bacterium AqS3]|nr:filamentous hemagglutinin N-terminal domain-containing protein [Gammaproteobacteria bacterium AqS3]